MTLCLKIFTGIVAVGLMVAVATFSYLRTRKRPCFPYMAGSRSDADFGAMAAKPGWRALHLGRHVEDATKPELESLQHVLDREKAFGHFDLAYYDRFSEQVKESERKILNFLIEAKRAGKSVVAYGVPGSRIPILDPSEMGKTHPNYLFILVWNLKDEVMKQMAHIREWGGRFVVPLPEIQVLE